MYRCPGEEKNVWTTGSVAGISQDVYLNTSGSIYLSPVYVVRGLMYDLIFVIAL